MSLSPEDQEHVEAEEKLRGQVRDQGQSRKIIFDCLGMLLVGLLLACSPSQPTDADIEATVEARLASISATAETLSQAPDMLLSPTAVPSATPTSVPPAPRALSYDLEVQSFSCEKETFGSFGGFATVEGEVKNISGRPLENVEAVAIWRTASGEFITSDSALTTFNPILPGQTSPFETISTLNPAMSTCSIGFQFLFGGTIATTRRAPTPTPIPTATPSPTPVAEQGFETDFVPRSFAASAIQNGWAFPGRADGLTDGISVTPDKGRFFTIRWVKQSELDAVVLTALFKPRGEELTIIETITGPIVGESYDFEISESGVVSIGVDVTKPISWRLTLTRCKIIRPC